MSSKHKHEIFKKMHSERLDIYMSLVNTLSVFDTSTCRNTVAKYISEITQYHCTFDFNSINTAIKQLNIVKRKLTKAFKLKSHSLAMYKNEYSKLNGSRRAFIESFRSSVKYSHGIDLPVDVSVTKCHLQYKVLDAIEKGEFLLLTKIAVTAQAYYSSQSMLKCIKYLIRWLDRYRGRVFKAGSC